MAKNSIFGDNVTPETTSNENKEFLSQHDIYKFISSVDSRIRKNVGSDFVLSKLDVKDKEYVVEMVGNAYNMKKLTEVLCKKIGEKHKDYETIKQIGENIFDSIMTKVYMLNILNRNVDKNYIVKIIGEAREEAETEETNKITAMLDKLKNKEDVEG